jgi:hypothetical protein
LDLREFNAELETFVAEQGAVDLTGTLRVVKRRVWFGRGARVAMAGCLVVAVVGLSRAVVPQRPSRPTGSTLPASASAPFDPTPGTFFLSVTQGPMVIKGDYLIDWPVYELQMRSIRTGAVERTILRSLAEIDAVVARDGSIVAAVDQQCRSEIERIDPATSQASVIRTIPGSVSEIALSPDGTRLAYVTTPSTSSPPPRCISLTQPSSPQRMTLDAGGVAGVLPFQLAVVTLATGAIVTTTTDMPGHLFTDPSWSPSGTELAVEYMGNTNYIVVVPSADPNFATARVLAPPAGCGWVGTTWTAAGIMAVKGCNPIGSELNPTQVVRLSPTGTVTAQWQLPACIGGVSLRADSTLTGVLVEGGIGSGDTGPCALAPGTGEPRTYLGTINGGALRPIAMFSANDELNVTGW